MDLCPRAVGQNLQKCCSNTKPYTLSNSKGLACDWSYPHSSVKNTAVKNLLAMQETQVRFLSREEPLEKEMATHSSILA